jgi:5S rRNA maturation endonuclease (ribonuclease M5)|tara:strand:- start:6201 stop:6722 length:522 start_codon:yes stop_codon:yes gene_type:complete
MPEKEGLGDWVDDRARRAGPPDREIRFRAAAKAIAASIRRNRSGEGNPDCPILVEGLRDEKALRALGFTGIVERVNRGWDRSRLVAYLHETYGTRNIVDKRPALILLMDWDRTGGRLQTALRDQLMAMDMPVDEDLRTVLLRVMKPEARTIEALAPHSRNLNPLIEEFLDDPL